MTASTAAPTRPALTPTDEQQAILDAFATGESLVVEAGAGSGKTSTMKMLANERPGAAAKSILYIAFNKSVAVEASRTFPASVHCSTVHALAYAAMPREIVAKLNNDWESPKDIALRFGAQLAKMPTTAARVHYLDAYDTGRIAQEAVKRFCKSRSKAIGKEHVELPPGHYDQKPRAKIVAAVVDVARRIWADLTDYEGTLQLGHDHYLKMFALQQPRLDYDVIILDEAQDTDPITAQIYKAQTHAQLVAVGDPSQAIYGFRGAISFISDFEATHRLALSMSFRFGQAIADEANVWLDALGANRIVGNPAIASTVGPVALPDAVLCRSNAGAIQGLIEAISSGRKAALLGGGKDVAKFAEAALKLQRGQAFTGHPDLKLFSTWSEVVDFVADEPEEAQQIAVKVNLIEKFGAQVIIDAIKRSSSETGAEVVFSTAHSAKGREWGSVRIGTDYQKPKDNLDGEPSPMRRDESMLAYVAITRAKGRLDDEGLAWVRSHVAALEHRGLPTVIG